MNAYKITSLLALLILVVAIPIYVISEPDRLAQAQVALRQEFVSDAAVMYVENCAVCHGAAGEGIGPVPALDNPALWTADYDTLFKTIARGRYGTTMAGWHVDEGGVFNDYQVDELVALIRYVDWSQVGELAAVQGLIPPTLPVPEVDDEFLAQIAALDPEGSQWAEGIHLFANNCTVCHGVDGEGSDLGLPLNTADVRAQEAVELARIITEGVPGTAMVAWKNTLSVDDIAALVAFLKNWDVIEAQGLALEPPEPIRIDLNNPEEVLALGERIYSTTCIACHGENGSGGTGPALNSLQVLTNSTDAQLESTIVNGGRRPNSTMPAFGDRLTSVEIGAVVDFIRTWEPTATWVENPRGTAQGGGPPWLRATPDASNPVSPGAAAGTGSQSTGQGNGQGGGPPWRQSSTDTAATQTDQATQAEQAVQGPAIQFSGQVVAVEDNLLTFSNATDGALVETMLGPPWFWSESGIPLNPGDQIELEGFESTDHMEVNWLANLTTGQRIELRTADGTPVWTGGN
jgi:mono/diheme cytochrome c family protein